MSEQLYKNANPNGAAGESNAETAGSSEGDAGANNDGNVYDADYKVEDDK